MKKIYVNKWNNKCEYDTENGKIKYMINDLRFEFGGWHLRDPRKEFYESKREIFKIFRKYFKNCRGSFEIYTMLPYKKGKYEAVDGLMVKF